MKTKIALDDRNKTRARGFAVGPMAEQPTDAAHRVHAPEPSGPHAPGSLYEDMAWDEV